MSQVDEYTTLLMHMDGANGGVLFSDDSEKKYAPEITAYGNACIKTDTSKFGGSSAHFDGSGDYIQTSAYDALKIGNNFTFDLWIKTVSTTQYACLLSCESSVGWTLLMNNASSGDIAFYGSGGTPAPLATSQGGYNDNQWHHVALVKSESNWFIFVDGVQRAATTNSTTISTVAAGNIGCNLAYTGRDFAGNIDELRLSDAARWTASFTPPAIRHEVDANTLLLLHMDGSDGSTIFNSEITLSHIITRLGDVNTNTTIKKMGTASAYFDGDGDGLNVTNAPGLEFESGDFTIEGWFYFLSNTKGYQMLIDKCPNSEAGWTLYLESNNILTFASSSTGVYPWSNAISGEIVPEINTWMHIAVVRYGNVWTMYKNGQVLKSITYTGGIKRNGANFALGNRANSTIYGFYGYMDEVRISKGIARWTGPFTPSNYPYFSSMDGSIVFGPFALDSYTSTPSASKINWNADLTPSGSAVNVYTRVAETQPAYNEYLPVTNGGSIPELTGNLSGKNLYIMAILHADNYPETPVLKELGYSITP